MRRYVSFALMVLFLPGLLSGEILKPMQVRPNVDIPDGEYLVYGVYTGGVKSAEFHMVTKYTGDGMVIGYLQMQKQNSATPLPKDYHNFTMQATVNLKTATMVRFVDNNEDYVVKQNKGKGVFYTEINFGSEINALQKIWDGYEVREKKIRVRNVDTKFPIWTNAGFLIWGGRLLDWDSGVGNVLIWDTIFKDPVPGTLYKTASETIKTKMASFETDRVGWKVSDPFLGALIKQLTDSITMNIEKGPKKRPISVETQVNGEKWFLEKESILSQ